MTDICKDGIGNFQEYDDGLTKITVYEPPQYTFKTDYTAELYVPPFPSRYMICQTGKGIGIYFPLFEEGEEI